MSECDAAELCTSNLHATCAVWTSRIGVKPALILPPAKHSVRTICGRTWLIGGGGWPQVRGRRASQRGARPRSATALRPHSCSLPSHPGIKLRTRCCRLVAGVGADVPAADVFHLQVLEVEADIVSCSRRTRAQSKLGVRVSKQCRSRATGGTAAGRAHLGTPRSPAGGASLST